MLGSRDFGGFRHMTRAGRRNKYHARPTVVDGVHFHSAGEARRWQELKLLQRAGRISELTRQVRIPLYVWNKELGLLVLDFVYRDNDDGGSVVWEDYKGMMTPLAAWKIKHAEAQYGIKIRLTGKR